MRVVVVDDEELAREELCYQLGQLGTAEVVAQAGNGLEAIAAVERHDQMEMRAIVSPVPYAEVAPTEYAGAGSWRAAAAR